MGCGKSMPRHAIGGDEEARRRPRDTRSPRGQQVRDVGGDPDSPQSSAPPTARRLSYEGEGAAQFVARSSMSRARNPGSESGSRSGGSSRSVSQAGSRGSPRSSRRDVDLQASAAIARAAQNLPAHLRVQTETRSPSRSPRAATESIGIARVRSDSASPRSDPASARSMSDVSATSSRASSASEKDLDSSTPFKITKGPPRLPLAPQSRTSSTTSAASRTASSSKQEPQPWPTPPSPSFSIPPAPAPTSMFSTSLSISKLKPPLASSPMSQYQSSPLSGSGGSIPRYPSATSVSGTMPRKPSASSLSGTPVHRSGSNPFLPSDPSASSVRGLRRTRDDSTGSLASSDLRSYPINLDDECENGGHLLPVEQRCSHRNCRCHTGCSSGGCRICLGNADGAEMGPGAESTGLVTPMERLRMVTRDVPSPSPSSEGQVSRRARSMTPRNLFPRED